MATTAEKTGTAPERVVSAPVRSLSWRWRLRGPRTGVLGFLAALGPALITANAGNDAGGIATYSVAGARYGFELPWLLPVLPARFIRVQKGCRLAGILTPRGLSEI